MKRDESVFFFTLIDFLVQVLFFGLAFYTVVAYATAKSNSGDIVKIDAHQVKVVTNWTWSESIPDLAGTLGAFKKPEDDFAQWANFISSHDLKDVTLAFNFVQDHGGIAGLGRAVRALGKPSCLAEDSKTNSASPIAALLLTDEQIIVQTTSPAFTDVTQKLGISVHPGSSLSLADFRNSFRKLPSVFPDCRYFVVIREDTLLGGPKKAVEAGFLTITRK